MTEIVDANGIRAAALRVADRLEGLRDLLNALDAAMGDGDLGISAAKAAPAVRDYVAANPPDDDIGKWLAGLGMAVNRVASSTMGTLTATALMRAGKEARGLAVLDAATLARMLNAAEAGIVERGKAQVGDKTILDALHPAAAAFEAAVAQGQDLNSAGDALLQAARTGRDAAIPLKSQVGRAAWVGDRTAGLPDPGTVLLVSVVEALMGAEQSQPGSTAIP
jgi:dihydroxyacetone kinase